MIVYRFDGSVCGLCRQRKPLCNSHATPDFVVRRHRRDGMTGYFRDGRNHNRRIQTSAQVVFPLLCRSCEDLFQESEHIFSRVFHAARDGNLGGVKIGEPALYFCASMTWRTLVSHFRNRCETAADDHNAEDKTALVELELSLREYLLGERPYPALREQHLYFPPFFETDVPFLNRLFHDALWSAFPAYRDTLYVVTNLPSVMIVCLARSSAALRENMWRGGTLVSVGDTLLVNRQEVEDDFLREYIKKAALDRSRAPRLSPRERAINKQRVEALFGKDQTASMKALLYDLKNERRSGEAGGRLPPF